MILIDYLLSMQTRLCLQTKTRCVMGTKHQQVNIVTPVISRFLGTNELTSGGNKRRREKGKTTLFCVCAEMQHIFASAFICPSAQWRRIGFALIE